jgi:6-phosphogluconate dehydrogenase
MSTNICDIGLAVMGQNLVLNMNDHGFKVAVYNRTTSKVDEFLANEAKDTQVVGAYSLQELVGLLKWCHKIMLMVSPALTISPTVSELSHHQPMRANWAA